MDKGAFQPGQEPSGTSVALLVREQEAAPDMYYVPRPFGEHRGEVCDEEGRGERGGGGFIPGEWR
jgi:hypothetical protein